MVIWIRGAYREDLLRQVRVHEELLDDFGGDGADLGRRQGDEDVLLQVRVDLEPAPRCGLLDLLHQSASEDLDVLGLEEVEAVCLHVLVQGAGDRHRVPEQRRPALDVLERRRT